MAKREDQSIRCSFCGKRETQVERLIAGPGVCICSDCVQACTELLRDEIEHNPLYFDPRTPEQIAAGDPKVTVRVIELSDSAVVLRAWLWAENVGAAFQLKCDINKSVKERFDREGVEFAYPHMMIVNKK